MSKKNSLITLCYNQLENATMPMLESLYKFTDPELFELIIVNNASTDGTKEFLTRFEKEKPNVKVINNDENLGFSKGMNQGINTAEGENIFFLNNDLLFTPNWLEKFDEILSENPDVGLISCLTNFCGEDFQLVENPKEYTKENYLNLWNPSKENKFEYSENTRVVFFCVGTTKKALEKVGTFDENYGRCWFEDNDFTLRTLMSGLKIAIAKDIFIFHNHSQSTSKFSKTAEGKALFKKNKEYFENKHPLFTVLKKQAEKELGKEFSKTKKKYEKYKKFFNIMLPIMIFELVVIIGLIIFIGVK